MLVRFNQALQHGHVPIRVKEDARQLETEILAIQGNMKRAFTAAKGSTGRNKIRDRVFKVHLESHHIENPHALISEVE